MGEIVFNGVKYRNTSEMSPEVRRNFERVMAGARDLSPGIHTVHTSKIVVNGREYGGPDELPPEMRKLYDEAMAGHVGGDSVKVTTRTAGNFSITFANTESSPPVLPAAGLTDDSLRNITALRERLQQARTLIAVLIFAMAILVLAFLFFLR